jgi:hypothetical protein
MARRNDCNRCAHYEPSSRIANMEIGLCLRYPPSIPPEGSSEVLSKFIYVRALEHACGEWTSTTVSCSQKLEFVRNK